MRLFENLRGGSIFFLLYNPKPQFRFSKIKFKKLYLKRFLNNWFTETGFSKTGFRSKQTKNNTKNDFFL